jgi:hypothetical protein
LQGKLYLDIDRSPVAPDVTGQAESFLSFVPDEVSMKMLPRISGNVYPAAPKLISVANASLADLELEEIFPQRKW